MAGMRSSPWTRADSSLVSSRAGVVSASSLGALVIQGMAMTQAQIEASVFWTLLLLLLMIPWMMF
jgi:hypothetical protein